MASTNTENDLLTFVDKSEAHAYQSSKVWRILVVDDEPDVHHVTKIALKGLTIEGRRLEFVHAYSAEEARTILAQNCDLAVILLDVVMETEDSGLQLARFIRDDLANHTIRIVLRTGQPGYAPELDTIRAYDINDYKTKSELTRVRLYTSLTVAIRSYWQIHQLEANRKGLELIVAACSELSKSKGLGRFAEGIVTQLCALLGISEEGLVCAVAEMENSGPYVLAAAGRYSNWIGKSLTDIPDERIRQELNCSIIERNHRFGDTTCLFLNVHGAYSLAIYVEVNHHLSEVDRNLLEVFCSNIAVAFENTQLYQRISNLAFEDQLLSLPNRNKFLELIERRDGEFNRLALVDIDSFSDINSTLDQDFGDAVLSAVANRLREILGPKVVIARIGNDVFGVLGPQGVVTEQRITDVFDTPFGVGSEHIRLSATTGFVMLSTDSSTALELLKNAGVALKQAKNFNRGKSVFFEKIYAVAARERMDMLSRLRLAFSAERLFLHYQPFVDLTNNKIVGAEALLRWKTESGEFVPPDRFIPLAEQSGLMVPIGEWIMRSALQFLRRLIDSGHHELRMAINVSHTQFREPEFVEKLLVAIKEYGVNPANVEIELTESVAIDNIDLIKEKLSAMQAAGIAIAIDDFGTGFSSLSVVRQLNVDRLKIDRSFVSGDDSLRGDYSIAEMVLNLAAQLGVATIAEGIETEEQAQMLRSMGCGDGQGYLFSKPISGDQFIKHVNERRI